jgi:hypothetical protein
VKHVAIPRDSYSLENRRQCPVTVALFFPDRSHEKTLFLTAIERNHREGNGRELTTTANFKPVKEKIQNKVCPPHQKSGIGM